MFNSNLEVTSGPDSLLPSASAGAGRTAAGQNVTGVSATQQPERHVTSWLACVEAQD